MSGPKVAVVGGSIAGLTAANVLRDASCEVDVYERSETLLSGFGTGIVVQPELVRYLLERTSTTLDDISVPSHEMRYFDAASGRNAGQVDAGWRFTAYNAVYQKLLDAFGTERYHLGKELVRVTPGVEGASASFADGTEVTADLVVCADGGGSVARAQLLGRKPDYAGYVTWRGMVDQRDVSPETWDFFQDAFTYGLLPDGHIIAYPISQVSSEGEVTGETRLNFQWYWNVDAGAALDELMTANDGSRRPVSVHFVALPASSLEQFHSRATNELAPVFRDLITGAPQPFVTIVADADVSQMAFDRVALIGDAAFTPRPHAAAGAAKAAADAWALADRLVEASGDVREALTAWEPERLAVGQAYLTKVRAMANALQHGGEFPPGAAEFRFGLPKPA
ncbi:MAG TPA: FAD binding domain-containing protein [Nocardioides sp.]|uniref:FAD binding domain-containing protein n=1 Tax=uncultured Nocardioides sp. TaxID=198441 RepID=UPI000ED6749B|nr:FAD binding domain-containing protein [uncultured Nocardioides sp.]HCB03251.1 2,6-dihydroxypyridine 3-hydroxylase [Nocardioides sp.]HRI94001.1 FAD binding domain-containing protein [Nocardioides sp.]HRK44015.1 FAD binding domain-containing protein [Nocardioides sp.]